MQTSGINFASDTLRCLLLRSTGSYTFNKDHDYVSDILSAGAVEISVSSYARQTLTGVTSTLDDTGDRSIVGADTISFGSLETGQSVSGIIIYKFITNDAASIPIMHIDGNVVLRAAAPMLAPINGTVTGATNANPCVISCTGHGLATGMRVKFSTVGGMTQLNGNVYTVTVINANSFSLDSTNSTSYGTFTSGGTFNQITRLYVEPLADNILNGASIDFGVGTGSTIYGNFTVGGKYVDIADPTAAIPFDATSNCATTAGFPIALGGGAFDVNPGTAMLTLKQR